MNHSDTAMVNAFVPGRAKLDANQQRLVNARAELLGPAYRLMYDSPLHFVKGEGVWLIDANGRRYLDAYNNVTSLGHCHPRVVEAICRQVATLATNTRYLHETILELAERLIATLPSELDRIMLTCTGSEANDLAWRIARQHTGGSGIIVTKTAYHGITDAVAQFSPSLGQAVDLGQHVLTIPPPDTCQADAPPFEVNVRHAIDKLRRHGIKPAMLIVDTMFTSDGIRPGPLNCLAAAAAVIRDAGGLFVADEVQPGFGRTGGQMWGFERHGTVPDIVTMGKPMGNGQPIAGLAVRAEIVEEFGKSARYFNTFGGNAVSCAAAVAVLDSLQEENLLANAERMGARLCDRLARIAGENPSIVAVRAAGLLVGVEIKDGAEPDAKATARIVNGLRDEGVLISSCGKGHNVLKIRPPLTIAGPEIDLIGDALESVLAREGVGAK